MSTPRWYPLTTKSIQPRLCIKQVRRLLSATFLLLCLCLTQFSFSAQTIEVLANTPELLREQRDNAKKELGQLPDDAKASASERQLKGTLKRRVLLLDEHLGQLETRLLLNQQQQELPGQLVLTQRQLDALNAAALTVSPASTLDRSGYEDLEASLQQTRNRLSLLLAQQSAQRQLEDNRSARADEIQQRIEAALQRTEILSQTASPPSGAADRRIAEMQTENAQIDKQIAEQWLTLNREEIAWIRDSDPLQRLQLALAEKQINALEQQLGNYNQQLQQILAKEALQADVTLQIKEQAAQSASSSQERFIARWEALIGRSQKNHRDLQSQLINLKKDESEQDKRLTTEKDELVAIRDLIMKSDIAGATAERIKQTLQQVKKRRALLTRTLRSDSLQALTQYRTQRFGVEDTLLGLSERFDTERDEIGALIDNPEKTAFMAQSDPLLASYRNALRDEKALLSEMISLGQNLQQLTTKRMETLNELQRFIRSSAFWLKDTKPLGPEAFRPLPSELNLGLIWLSNLTSAEIRTRLADVLTTPISLISALLLFPILPLVLFAARNRIRAITRRINDRVIAEGKLLHLSGLVILTGLLSAAVLPIYFYVVAKLLSTVQLPANIGQVGSHLFEQLALFLFLWFFCRSFFAQRSITEVQFGLPRPAANAFYAAIRWVLFGYLLFLAPRNLLLQVPFEFEALPRLLYSLFLITVTLGVVLLVRQRSPFVQHQLATLGVDFISRQWGSIATLIFALAGGALALDLAGHRYASASIITSLAGSLVIILILPPLYRKLMAALLHGLSRRSRVTSASENAFSTDISNTIAAKPSVTAATDDPADASAAEATSETDNDETGRLQRILRLLFVLTGAILLLDQWGLDEQALRTLDEMHLYTVRITGAESEFVTAGDVLRCILFLVGTFWILRVLPGLYGVALFPRFQLDEGVKYAILTISRYTVFVLGFFFGLAEMHLDLGRLGWMMAAIGVGLGFGLQEIVSNFVSGLILLIERPVRPGDTVTIGTLSGKVARINIRATTIVNFDRQEVMVPNRTLITSNVTNWTRSDTINRLVIPIGVAYGSDIDRVGELLLAIATDQIEVLKDPAPSVVFMQHGESSLDFNLRVFVPSPAEIMLVRDRINRLINKAFAEEGIEIPFPQRDLHIRSNDLQVLKTLQPGTVISGRADPEPITPVVTP